MQKTNILVAGIGGVGGFFGGLLAKQYENAERVEVNFLARGAHLAAIQEKGLKILVRGESFMAHPYIATDDPSELGIADYVIVSTKSYDLESVIHQLKPCINKDTIILPLLNGVDSKNLISRILPENLVLDGCVYIVSRLKDTGIIENSGNIQLLYFGLDNFEHEKLKLLESIMIKAGIEVQNSVQISSIIWTKFIFISPTASATSYFNQSIGAVLVEEDKFQFISSLIKEIIQLAKAKKVMLSEDIYEKTFAILQSMSYETTSSMHVDFQKKNGINELESITNYVILESKKYGVQTPFYEKVYEKLKKQ